MTSGLRQLLCIESAILLRDARESDMTREKWRAIDAFESKNHRNVGEDPSKMICEVTPGKRGGEYDLPFGGQMKVGPGVFGKKDIVTCCMVSPNNRYKYIPPLRPHEHLLSEIFLYSTTSKTARKGVTLVLPCYPDNAEICDVVLMVKSIRDEDWIYGEFDLNDARTRVEFEVNGPGIYVVVSTPRVEKFDAPVSGMLYNAKLSKQISVRFPKKATDQDIEVTLQILPLNRKNLPALRQDYPREMTDLVTASDYYEIRPNIHKEFKRAITVKLPLPPLDVDEFSSEDMAILCHTDSGWVVLESTLKFTKTSVSFDTRVLSRFCVALARPQRKKRLKEAFARIEAEEKVIRGEILPFIHLAEKCWTLWFDIVPNHRKDETISMRVQQGFRSIGQMQLYDYTAEEKKPFRRTGNWRAKAKQMEEEESKKVQRFDLDLLEGRTYNLDIGGDLLIAEDDPGKAFLGLHYYDRLPSNYRRFLVEPNPIDGSKILTGILKVHIDEVQAEGTTKKLTIRTYDVDVDKEHLEAYFYVEPEPEPDPEPEPELIIEADVEDEPKQIQPRRVPNKESWLRLLAHNKPPRQVPRESKVLTGRSLMSLAREVEQGLTLAIYLDLNDSTITGMGFDALAKGQSLIDITYRILLLWKRKSAKYKDKQIDQLVRALQEMGRNDLASVVLEKHRENEELTPECFSVYQ